jgi:hypothetical protein
MTPWRTWDGMPAVLTFWVQLSPICLLIFDYSHSQTRWGWLLKLYIKPEHFQIYLKLSILSLRFCATWSTYFVKIISQIIDVFSQSTTLRQISYNLLVYLYKILIFIWKRPRFGSNKKLLVCWLPLTALLQRFSRTLCSHKITELSTRDISSDFTHTITRYTFFGVNVVLYDIYALAYLAPDIYSGSLRSHVLLKFTLLCEPAKFGGIGRKNK